MTTTMLDQRERKPFVGRRFLGAILALLIYVGMPVVAQAIDPIFTNTAIGRVHYDLTHLGTVWTNFLSGVNVTHYAMNVMVMVIWIFWIYAILSSMLTLIYIARHKEMTSRARHMTKLAALIIFLVWQGAASSGAGAAGTHNAATSTPTRTAPVVQLASATISVSQTGVNLPAMQVAAPTQTATTVTVNHGDTLWGIAEATLIQQGHPATNQEISSMVDSIASLNRLTDPGLIYAGQVLNMPGTATSSLVPTVALGSLAVPPPTVTLDGTSSAVRTPTEMVATPTHHAQDLVVFEALEFALLSGAALMSLRKIKAQQATRRGRNRIPQPVTDLGFFVALNQTAALYEDVLNTLKLLMSIGAPRIGGMWVGKESIDIELDDVNAALDTQNLLSRTDERTLTISRPVPEVTLEVKGNPYGMLMYVGQDSDGEAYLANLGSRGVLGIENAPFEVWRGLLTQFGWVEWLSNTMCYALRPDDFKLPSDLIDDTIKDLIPDNAVEFALELADEQALLKLAFDKIAFLNHLRRGVVDGSAAAVRLDTESYSTSMVFSLSPLSDDGLYRLTQEVGRSDSLTVLVAQPTSLQSNSWKYEGGQLLITDSRGTERSIRPVSVSEGQMLRQASFLAAQYQMVPNTTTMASLRRPGSTDAPLIRVCTALPYVTGIPQLSPLAIRIAMVMAFSNDALTLDEIAMTVAPGMSVNDSAFIAAWGEIELYLAPYIERSDGRTLVLSSEVGTDIGRLFSTGDLDVVKSLLTDLPFGTLSYNWLFAAQRVDAISARMIDAYVDAGKAAISQHGRIDVASELLAVLSSVFGQTDRIGLLELAIMAYSTSPEEANAHWESRGQQRAAEYQFGDNPLYDVDITDEAASILASAGNRS